VIQPIGERIAALRKAARAANIPTIFVNDNYHKWKSDFHHVIEDVLKEEKPCDPITCDYIMITTNDCLLLLLTGRILAELLKPDQHDCS
jgi:nicotinamidase-related amidase